MASHGTSWGKWDLHVHTPLSIEQGYGGDTEDAWEQFISDIENLSQDFKVIGINDYWFLDGYKRVIREHANGRMQNIDLFLPVIEMRLSHFGGSENSLSRVNLHVVFDNSIPAETIENQFIASLSSKVDLLPDHRSFWNGVITKESISDLGRKIKDTVPESQVNRYGSDLKEGFNNLNVTLDSVKDSLDNHYFKGKALIAVGKAEWSGIRWNNQSIAAKKNIVNSSDFIFSAYTDTNRWPEEVKSFKESNIQYKVIDCSDSHYHSDSDNSMRLGNCSTWLNTIPTFAGLVYALSEFDRRVFVGFEPPARARIRQNSSKFIDKIKISSTESEFSLFNHDIRLNPGFVAIVGNKGQGKSALLDCIALAGNSSRNNDFAFLNTNRFLHHRNLNAAKKYSVKINWLDGSSKEVALNTNFDGSSSIQVEYLPQMFIEKICNSDSYISDTFENELREIIFTHIPVENREGKVTFNELLESKLQSYSHPIENIRNKIGKLSKQYEKLLLFKWEYNEKETISRINEIKKQISNIENSINQINAEFKATPEKISDRENRSESSLHIEGLRNSLEQLELQLTDLKKEKSDILDQISEISS
ncbi:ATP-binding protein, partial [Rothia nasimurium]|uniref:ATP-binding protein n=1 Tax=Rothia nasimurium TaxID=85336 RepID=UPI001F173D2C